MLSVVERRSLTKDLTQRLSVLQERRRGEGLPANALAAAGGGAEGSFSSETRATKLNAPTSSEFPPPRPLLSDEAQAATSSLKREDVAKSTGSSKMLAPSEAVGLCSCRGDCTEASSLASPSLSLVSSRGSRLCFSGLRDRAARGAPSEGVASFSSWQTFSPASREASVAERTGAAFPGEAEASAASSRGAKRGFRKFPSLPASRTAGDGTPATRRTLLPCKTPAAR